MSRDKLKITLYDENDEIDYEFPARMEVCDRCEGHGMHLNPSIGNHAYSMEEFCESFDEEEQEQYFTRGGIYDVACYTCKGLRVVSMIDEEALVTDEQKKMYELYLANEEERYQMEAEQRSEMRYCGEYEY